MKIDYSVYLVTDQFDLSQDEFLNVIEEAVIGGTSVVQLREKNSSTLDFYELALKVKKITDNYDVPLIINDRIDVAQAVDAAGVHLGQDDMPCCVARKILGSDKIIGISTQNTKESQKAVADGADYLGVGAIYPTDTKDDAKIAYDIDNISDIIDIPMVAIGGIKEHNTREVIDKYGFDGVAIVSAIMKSDNPRKTSEHFVKLVNDAK